jgi:beta-glucosidase
LATAIVGAWIGAAACLAQESASAAESRVEALLAKMTLEEKLGQLTQQWGGESQDVNPGARDRALGDILGVAKAGLVGSFLGAHGAEYTNKLQRAAIEESRLGIPLILGNDVIHGYRTIFPIPLAEAASWDTALIERACRVAAAEARAAGTHWTFAPMIDVCRDPRWGRIAETAGEDPYLGARVAAARVRGFQGTDLTAPDCVMACAKHFVAYGAAEGGRDYNTVDISVATLREIHLPPFEAAVRAGAGSIMSAFNEINGVPATANELTLNTILRKEWGFGGFVVSDWTSITEMIAHGYARDPAHAAAMSISAGVDMDMCSFSYRDQLVNDIKADRFADATVDTAVRRVLKAKQALGLFDSPYTDASRESKVILSAENRAVAREMVRKSIVLLKNEGGLLPLSDDPAAIAVIGPLADNQEDLLGTWAAEGKPADVVTVLAGIQQRAGAAVTVAHAQGCDVRGGSNEGVDEAVQLAERCDIAIVVVGESEDMSGEGHSRSTLDLPPMQRELLQAVHATGTPMVVVLMSGRPLSVSWCAENAPAILAAWHPGIEGGHGIADVLFGDFNPGGKLPATFPRTVGQVPIHYNHKNTGRPPNETRYTSKYIDVPWSPLFPFGHGLSYTTFEFSNLRVQPPRINRDGEVTVLADVTNSGQRDGDEVAQLYIRDLVGSTTRPVKELKGFQRITLEPGQTQTVKFTLSKEELRFYHPADGWIVEPGDFQVWVGPSSADGLEARFTVTAD